VGANRPARAVLLLSLLAVVAGLSLGPMAESDLFFRLKAGEEILARHALPGRNLFSFTYPDYPDIDTSWLFEVGAAALYRLGGFPALVLAKTALLLATFAGAFAVCRRRGAGLIAAALTLAGAAYAVHERFVERPHVFSLAGEVLLLLAIDAIVDARDARDARDASDVGRRRARGIALGVLGAVALWANLHAGVFLAPVLLALAAAGTWLDRRIERPAPAEPAARRLALLAVGAAVATLATPVGWGLVRYLRLHTVLPALHPVDEFRAASWVSDAPLLLYGAAFLAVVGLVRPRLWRVLLPPIALGLLALRSIRFGADFALFGAPVVALGLTRLGERLSLRVPSVLRGQVSVVATAALLLGGALGPRLTAARQGRPVLPLGLDESALPLDAIRFATENGLRTRMYSDFEIGSYLLFEGFPRFGVFVDPRLPAYPPELHALLGRSDVTRAEWSAAMRRYGVDSAVLAYAGLNRRVAWWDPAEWALVYRAHDARVFVRRAPRFRALIAAREIPATFSFTLAEGTATQPLGERPSASPVEDCEWQRRLGDLLFDLDGAASPRARGAYRRALAAPAGCLAAAEETRLGAWLGAVELGEGHAAAALALLDRALSHGDLDVATRANRAVALEGLGRKSEAAAAWGDVAARAVGTPLAPKALGRRAELLRAME
jgi:hypothetical protein